MYDGAITCRGSLSIDNKEDIIAFYAASIIVMVFVIDFFCLCAISSTYARAAEAVEAVELSAHMATLEGKRALEIAEAREAAIFEKCMFWFKRIGIISISVIVAVFILGFTAEIIREKLEKKRIPKQADDK